MKRNQNWNDRVNELHNQVNEYLQCLGYTEYDAKDYNSNKEDYVSDCVRDFISVNDEIYDKDERRIIINHFERMINDVWDQIEV